MYKYDVALLVVVYNKKFSESITLASILNLKLDKERTFLSIWNNGPNKLAQNEMISTLNERCDLHIGEDIGNRPLSKIYNQFVEETNSRVTIILDDDTEINQSYFSKAKLLPDYKVALPLVKDTGKIFYPVVDGKVVSKTCEIDSCSTVFSAMSGVMIGRKILDDVYSKYQSYFDERFALYGVDTSFFARVNSLDSKKGLSIIDAIEHSLSENLDEISEKKKFREKETAIAEGIYFRHYMTKWKLIKVIISNVIIYTFGRIIKAKDCYYRENFIKGVIYGKHDKC